MKDAYWEFLTTFLPIVDSVGTLRVKSNTKPFFDVDVWNAIENHDQHYKKFKWSGKENEKINLKCAKGLLKNLLIVMINLNNSG